MKARKRLDALMADPLFAAGYEMRREVMGTEAVERDQDVRLNDDFQRPMWELGIRGCYGLVWTRPGLSRRDRSIATLSAMVALGTLEELKVHTRNAINNGLTPEEISEIILHGAIYSGFPKAVAAFKAARSVLEALSGAAAGGAKGGRRAAAGSRGASAGARRPGGLAKAAGKSRRRAG